jgi:hypothetical protein
MAEAANPEPNVVLDVEEPSTLGSATHAEGRANRIRTTSQANPLWGTPRIHGELLKAGIDVCQATVARYMVHHRRPPSQTWRTFLANHLRRSWRPPSSWCHRDVPPALRPGHHRPRAPPCPARGRPRACDRGMDRATVARGVSLARGAAISPPDRDPAFTGWTETAKTTGIDDVLTAPRSAGQNAASSV